MSLSGGTAGGKGVDSNAVDTYDSGDEWDIGVGNLIIDLDADLEKDKLEMSGTKDGGSMAAPPSAVAALPENIKFVSPVPTSQGKESKSKSKRNKSSKDSSKTSAGDGTKKDVQGRTLGEGAGTGANMGVASTGNSGSGKGQEKGGKSSRSVPSGKKDKEGGSGKNKKEKSEVVGAGASEKDTGAQALVLGTARGGSFEGSQNADLAAAEQVGNIALEAAGLVQPLAIKTESEDLDNGECRSIKKVKSEKMESPVSTPAPPPLHLLAPMGNSDIASPCEQIMVRTRSVAVNTADVALATEPECLGPCEPGTSVNLEGIVWQETEDGMLVVNVTWRNKTYVGTLLDCTRHDWAPPRFCESPTSDLEMRNGRGRGKRMRPNSNTPVNENSNSSDNKGSSSSKTRAGSNSKGRRGSQNSSERRTPPNSNTEDVKASPSSASKRKSKPTSDMEPNSSSEDTKGSKRMRTNSSSGATPSVMPVPTVKTEPLPPPLDRNCSSPVLIDCPHPNCNKKYKHINGLKYHQARAHNDDDIKLDLDGDSEYGEDSTLHPEPGSCNGASISQKGCLSPARSVTPKGRGFDTQSPSPSSGKFTTKPSNKKKSCDVDPEAVAMPMDACEDGPCLTDEASNDGMEEKKNSDKEKSKKSGSSSKSDKLSQKGLKSTRPIAPAIPPQQLYAFQTATFPVGSPGSSPSMTTVVQAIPKSPQLKAIQPKPTVMGDPLTVNQALSSSKDKKKKDKKRKEVSKEGDSPKPPGKGGKPEEGKSPYSEASDSGSKNEGLLNGSSDPHQSRLASIKAEADKIYSFTDNAPSPSIGVASRIDSGGMVQPLTPLHVVTQNGADNSSVKTNSPAYSDISDAGEDGEGKVEGVKAKTEDQSMRESAKKALFTSQTTSKESPYYTSYESYYSPSYANPSPGGSNPNAAHAEGQSAKVKKEEEQEQNEEKGKGEPPEERKPEISASGQQQQQQQPSVIQQRSNMYMQPLYYNQYAYVPPFGYHPDQAYHNHLMNTNPAYRQQYEERQRQAAEQHRAAEKKSDAALKERESSMKEEWKQKASVPPTLSKAPSVSDLGKPPPPSKQKDSSEPPKSVIIPKGEDAKIQGQQAEGLKVKLGEAAHHTKEESKASLESSRQSGMEAMWYRQEPDSRLWPYVYPNKYPEAPKQQQDEEQRWKEERERKGKEERSRPKETTPKEDNKESTDPRASVASAEDHRGMGKDPRPTAHMQFTSPLAPHQAYMPFVHGYTYGQGYDPNHPGYRGMPSVMMQNYPGSYLSAGYSFSPYGSKMGSGEDSDKARASPTVSSKSAPESKALEILHQHASQYKSKSPTVSDKPPHDRERAGPERDMDRPRSSPSQRVLAPHHHLGYPLLSGQYDLSYAAGLSSSAIVASQQASAPSLYPPARR
ncbi:zinc finger protein 609-like [Scleropages formosus]|uniref:Zinc finger protein 609 n=1 Tax=Scleropages formosus TaxID=113540 RepID=A0A8C9REV7_SCLFO|nr:zinc finger protein 609-like [Scleropages formosus]XP_018608180.1 zinc finger protein 609-like [Scleropages formosus]XP_018608181.1 zinc finger protein 609-like [Scleropages formosus]